MNKKTLAIGTVFAALILGGAFVWQGIGTPTANTGGEKSVEELRAEMDSIAKYEFEHGCLEDNGRGQKVFCGESKTKVDAAEARYQAALHASTLPDSAAQKADTNAIRNFMGDQSMSLDYSRSSGPANFSVGIVTPLSDGGDTRSETPAEWKRTVNVYRATQEIKGTCEVYEFEVYPGPERPDVVQVHVVYPESYTGQCDQKDGLFSPEVSQSEIKRIAEGYLIRGNPKHIKGLEGEEDDGYTVTELSREDTGRWEWKWQDTSYKLPAGISGDSAVDSKPTVRLHISSAGKLLQYNNTIPLFEN